MVSIWRRKSFEDSPPADSHYTVKTSSLQCRFQILPTFLNTHCLKNMCTEKWIWKKKKKWQPRRELNPDLRFRKPLLYPFELRDPTFHSLYRKRPTSSKPNSPSKASPESNVPLAMWIRRSRWNRRFRRWAQIFLRMNRGDASQESFFLVDLAFKNC